MTVMELEMDLIPFYSTEFTTAFRIVDKLTDPEGDNLEFRYQEKIRDQFA